MNKRQRDDHDDSDSDGDAGGGGGAQGSAKKAKINTVRTVNKAKIPVEFRKTIGNTPIGKHFVDKALSRTARLEAMDPQWSMLGMTVGMDLGDFINEASSDENLDIIGKEFRFRKTQKQTSDSSSHSLLGALELVYPEEEATGSCSTAIRCLVSVTKQNITEDNLKTVLAGLHRVFNVRTNTHTESNLYTEIRSAVTGQDWYVAEDHYELIKPAAFGQSSAKSRQRKIQDAESKEARLANLTLVPFVTVARAVTKWSRDHATLAERIALLQICSGARLVEALLVSHMTRVESEIDPDYVNLGGLSKDTHFLVRGLAKEEHKKLRQVADVLGKQEHMLSEEEADTVVDTRLARPVLFLDRPDKLIDVFDDVRSRLASAVGYRGYSELSAGTKDDRVAITRYFNKAVNDIVKRDLPELTVGGRRSGSHDLRRIYASWSYQRFCPEDVRDDAWVRAMYNHTSSDTSRAYLTVKVTSTPTRDDPHLATSVAAFFVEKDREMKELRGQMKELRRETTEIRALLSNRNGLPPLPAGGEDNEGEGGGGNEDEGGGKVAKPTVFFLPKKDNQEGRIQFDREKGKRNEDMEAKVKRMFGLIDDFDQMGADTGKFLNLGDKKGIRDQWIQAGSFGTRPINAFIKKLGARVGRVRRSDSPEY